MARWEDRKSFALAHPDLSDADILREHTRQYKETNGPMPLASLDDVLDHFDHVVRLVGIDHVGIGSDYDGVGDTLPTGLEDVSTYPNLVRGLLERGYSDADIVKVLGENLLRVWQIAENHAASRRQAATTS
jgi:membrane dipeptidase